MLEHLITRFQHWAMNIVPPLGLLFGLSLEKDPASPILGIGLDMNLVKFVSAVVAGIFWAFFQMTQRRASQADMKTIANKALEPVVTAVTGPTGETLAEYLSESRRDVSRLADAQETINRRTVEDASRLQRQVDLLTTQNAYLTGQLTTLLRVDQERTVLLREYAERLTRIETVVPLRQTSLAAQPTTPVEGA